MKKILGLKKKMVAFSMAAMFALTAISPVGVWAQDLPDNMQEVTTTGTLTVSLPDGITETNYDVTAYEVLKLIIADSDAQPTKFTNNNKNVYIVADEYDDFFKKAKTDYESVKTKGNIYLTYDTNNNCLRISDTGSGKDGVDYIKVSNSTQLDDVYFGADLISRIASSKTNDETTASTARLLSDYLSLYTVAKGITGTAGSATKDANDKATGFAISDLPYGYYLVLAKDNGDNNGQVVNQSILNFPATTAIALKASPITITKTVENTTNADASTVTTDGDVKKTSAAIGDTLSYTVDSHIIGLTSYDLYDYISNNDLAFETPLASAADVEDYFEEHFGIVVADTLVNQELDVDSVKVTIGTKAYVTLKKDNVYYVVTEADKTANKTINAIAMLSNAGYKNGENFFAVNFNLDQLKKDGLDGQDVTVTYDATLMSDAACDDAKNEATITYSSDPYEYGVTDGATDETEVYTYDLQIDKVFSDGSTDADVFAGVTFAMYKDAALSDGVKLTGSNGEYTVAVDGAENTVVDASLNTTDGTLKIHGLGEGTYYVSESITDALKNDGYTKVETIKVVVSAVAGDEDLKVAVESTDQAGEAAWKIESTVEIGSTAFETAGVSDGYGIEFKVLNQKGFILPITGGLGNWIFAIAGILLVVGGVVIVIMANRKKENEA